MGFLDLPWSKIFATFFGVALAGVELWEYKRKRQNIRWKKRKKLISISLISGLLISTLWSDVSEESKNILQEKNRNDNIIKDSIRLENLSKRTDVIINNVGYAVQGIEESKSVLLLLDSMTVNTNNRLDLAIEKSKELVRLEKAKFNLGRPKLEIVSNEVNFIPTMEDSTKLDIIFRMVNISKRSAINTKYISILILYNYDSKIRNFYENYSEELSPAIISGNYGVSANATTFFRVNKDEVLSRYKNAIYIIRLTYQDEFDNQKYDENLFFSAKGLKHGILHFFEADVNEKNWSSQYLMNHKMQKYLTDSTIKKYN